MKKSNFHHLLLIPFVYILSLPNAIFSAQKPNILFLFADDQSYDTVGELGLTDIETPNLDRLMKQGTSFARAYNMGSWSGAVCIASRHMLNTGRFIWQAEAASKQAEEERKKGRFWSENMKEAGYKTYFTGKWHVRAKAELCFDVATMVRGGMPNQTPEGYHRPLPDGTDPWSPYDPKFEGFWKGGKHWSEVVADETLKFLSEAKSHVGKKPFFAYISFNAPHDPRQSPKSFIDRYPLTRIKIPKNFLPQYPFRDQIKCPHKLRDESLAPMPRTKNAIKVHLQEYYAIITHMDEQIGRILEELEKSGLADNTYVFYSSDHGLAVGQHGFLGKQNLYEHSTRVPFIVKGPGIPEGKTVRNPIYLQDAMASSLALAGVAKPNHVDFHNILPLAKGESVKSPYSSIYGAFLDAQRSITHKDLKLIAYPAISEFRVYDLGSDPLERNDLSKTKKGSKIIGKLFPMLIDLQEQMGDPLDLSTSFSIK